MTKITRLTVSLVFLLAFTVISPQGPERVMAQTSASAGASTTVMIPLEIIKVQLLSFGTFAPPTSGTGTIKVESDGVSSETITNVTLLGTTGVGYFAVKGEPNTAYKMDTGSETAVTLTRTGGGGTPMTANLEFWSVTKAAIAFPNTLGTGGLLNGAGTDDLRYGGTLTVNPNQEPGIYNGYFNVVLNY